MPAAHGAEIDMYDGRFETLPQAMLALGYRTAAISANTLVFSTAQGFGPGFLRFDDSFYSLADGFTRTMLGRRVHKTVASVLGWTYHPVKRSAHDVTAQAMQWLVNRGDRPFFLVLNYFDVHNPAAPRAPASGDGYDDSVTDVDLAVGDLLDGLTSRGITDKTVIVVTADHGESLGEREADGHGTSLNIEQVHVPLILRYPPRIPAGQRVTRAVSQTSLPATLLDLAGMAPATGGFPGPTLSPLWQPRGQRLAWPMPRSELRYRPWQRTLEGQDLLKSLVDLPWHYVDHSIGGDELYNLLEDPGESVNLAARIEYRHLLEQFRNAVAASDAGGS
jgi:arylsulfatase A-like enzyme